MSRVSSEPIKDGVLPVEDIVVPGQVDDDAGLLLRDAVQAVRAPLADKRAPAPVSSVFGRASAARSWWSWGLISRGRSPIGPGR